MTVLWILIWFVCGILGCLVFNKHFKYEEPWLKYVWNFLVCSMGWIGLMVAGLSWLTIKLDNTKK